MINKQLVPAFICFILICGFIANLKGQSLGTHSVIQAIQADDGKFESKALIPREGWKHTHLFGGIGAFPRWVSNEPVPPKKPQVFYVNGTRNRMANLVDLKILNFHGILKIHFEGHDYSIRIPY